MITHRMKFTRWCALLVIVFSVCSLGRAEEAIKLEASAFAALEPLGWTANPETFPEWQDVTLEERDKDLVKFSFPARLLVGRAAAQPAPGKSNLHGIAFDRVDVDLSRHGAYFRTYYSVQVTLKGAGGKKWFFVASFDGKRDPGYLKSEEARQKISKAIMDCLRGIDRTGGFLP